MKVRSPDGTTWRVTRRWVPWRRRVTALDDGASTPFDLQGLGDDPISAIIAVVALIIMIPFLVVAVVVSLELLLLLLLVPFAVLGRVLLGRRWTVEVRRGWRPWSEEEVGGWGHSRLRIRSLGEELRRGQVPVQTLRLSTRSEA